MKVVCYRKFISIFFFVGEGVFSSSLPLYLFACAASLASLIVIGDSAKLFVVYSSDTALKRQTSCLSSCVSQLYGLLFHFCHIFTVPQLNSIVMYLRFVSMEFNTQLFFLVHNTITWIHKHISQNCLSPYHLKSKKAKISESLTQINK